MIVEPGAFYLHAFIISLNPFCFIYFLLTYFPPYFLQFINLAWEIRVENSQVRNSDSGVAFPTRFPTRFSTLHGENSSVLSRPLKYSRSPSESELSTPQKVTKMSISAPNLAISSPF